MLCNQNDFGEADKCLYAAHDREKEKAALSSGVTVATAWEGIFALDSTVWLSNDSLILESYQAVKETEHFCAHG